MLEAWISIKEQFKKSFKWTLIGDSFKTFAHFIKLYLIIALFSSGEIVDYGIASTLINMIAITAMLGLNQSIVSRKFITSSFKSTFFWGSIILGLAGYFILLIFSKEISKYYEIESLINIFSIYGLMIIIITAQSIPLAILQRKSRFREINESKIYKDASILLSIFTLYAFGVRGIYILIYPELFSSLIYLLVLLKKSKFNPKFYFKINLIIESKLYNLSALISNISNYICNNGITLFMANLYAIPMFSAYLVANKLIETVNYLFAIPFGSNIFPIFQSAERKRVKLFDLGNYVLKYTGIFLIPLLILIFATIEAVSIYFKVFHNDNTTQIFKILLIALGIRCLNFPSNPILYAIRRPNISSYLVLIRLIIFMSVFLFNRFFILELEILLIVLIIADFIVANLYAFITIKLLKCSYFIYLYNVFKILIFNIVIFSPIMIFNLKLNITSLGLILASLILWLLLLKYFYQDAYKSFINLLRFN